MQIYVKNMHGQIIRVEVDGTDTIKTVKLKVKKITGNPVNRMRVLYNGVELFEAHRLADYKIGPDATLLLL